MNESPLCCVFNKKSFIFCFFCWMLWLLWVVLSVRSTPTLNFCNNRKLLSNPLKYVSTVCSSTIIPTISSPRIWFFVSRLLHVQLQYSHNFVHEMETMSSSPILVFCNRRLLIFCYFCVFKHLTFRVYVFTLDSESPLVINPSQGFMTAVKERGKNLVVWQL